MIGAVNNSEKLVEKLFRPLIPIRQFFLAFDFAGPGLSPIKGIAPSTNYTFFKLNRLIKYRLPLLMECFVRKGGFDGFIF
jgi:hypothetical protein